MRLPCGDVAELISEQAKLRPARSSRDSRAMSGATREDHAFCDVRGHKMLRGSHFL